MRYGKVPRGLIVITVKPNGMKTWALSLHICRIQKDIRDTTHHDSPRDVDEKPSQGGNEAARVQMTVGNSGTSMMR